MHLQEKQYYSAGKIDMHKNNIKIKGNHFDYGFKGFVLN